MVKGRCLCGAIEVDFAGETGPGVLCLCGTCQISHSSASYNLQAKRDQLKVTKGTPTVRRLALPRRAERAAS